MTAKVWDQIRVVLKLAIILLTPVCWAFLFLPQVVGDSPEMRCLYVAGVMAVYWATEALPLPITSLLPIALFPLLGIQATEVVVGNYMKGVTMMFFGGLIVALAVEHSGLHKRIALRLIMLIGTSPHTIMLSFMLATAFLSMWISNTASTAMMLPMVQAVVESLSRSSKAYRGTFGGILLLSVAYSANIGGTAVITGTPPNLFVIQDNVLPEESGVNFATWMAYAVPLMLINLFACWIYMMIVAQISIKFIDRADTSAAAADDDADHLESNGGVEHCEMTEPEVDTIKAEKEAEAEAGSGDDSKVEMIVDNGRGGGKSAADIGAVIRCQAAELGRITYQEIIVTILFSTLVLLWFFQRPQFIDGWADLIDDEDEAAVKIKAATPAILIVVLLFMIPRSNPLASIRNGEDVEGLLTWKVINDKLPWNVILLLGGGIALSSGFKASGLSQLGVSSAQLLVGLEIWQINLIICLATSAVTEFVSNTATASIVLPMLVQISKSLCKNPAYLVLSAAITCSNAFMLPVATAPNAIVFGAAKGKLSTKQMIAIGLPLNLISIGVTFLAISTWGTHIFGLDQFPEWALDPAAAAAGNCSVVSAAAAAEAANATIADFADYDDGIIPVTAIVPDAFNATSLN